MKFHLASRIRRPPRRPIVLPNIAPTQVQADDLYRLYLRIIVAWREGAPAIVAEYERTLAELQTDSAASTTGAIDSVADAIRRLVLMLTPDLRRWALRVEEVHRGKWTRGILSATDIDLSSVLSPFDVSETVEAAIEWNVSLIRDIAEETRRRIANAVFAGFQQRAQAREIAREISEATGLARARARRVAADQTVKLGSRLNQARQEQAGLTSFKWRHSGKRHPREHHLARDGKVFRWSDPVLKGDLPGQAPFCGCTGQGIVTFDE